ncbi:hypothetical protein Csp2054_13300 [Curtobacterium sp. 'Ferrero']|uniref:glycosyltransferase family 2 protein n=1 Tax=Curtobacterium sp. 'Ferrero' TaxID=2033654 RepID=UPI000BCCA29C|nr:glycosyltransferase family 2 protein [Curtobacterium sp. 'Ferrero']PCN47251.1 hypothetical protein Csp2054_13300 [Curtobacterium sp. 'Ferrero']
MTGSHPAVSVVVAARNSAPWFGELIASVARQLGEGLEVIVVDNGSTDETSALIRAFAEQHASVRHVLSGATGAAEARNEGVARATGRYLVFADSDDLVPDGAYRAMLDSLEASGSDMAIGDHLKFSATETWSPTKRWYPFDRALVGVAPDEVPELLSGRPCWNRMFRRSFWDRVGLRFPEVASVEDIEPMTRAFVEARAIDVVRECVYLYRDRGDSSSLSLRADADVTVRYLEQELACAELVRDDPVLRLQHAEIVLDADGWAHLRRFLATSPDGAAAQRVAAATDRLLAAVPLDGIDAVAAPRRALWSLVLLGEWSTARDFVVGTTSADVADGLAAWSSAVSTVLRRDAVGAGRLAVEGLVPAFVNGADAVDGDTLRGCLAGIEGLQLPHSGAALVDAMAAAIGSGDVTAVRTVSSLRHVVPLVVDRVDSDEHGLTVSGAADLGPVGAGAVLHLAGAADAEYPVSIGADGRWRAELRAAQLPHGRHGVTVSFDGVSGRFPVVTARMPLPPVGDGIPMQPLADRRDGWRFLVDRRAPARGGLGGLLRKVAGRRR